MEKKKMKIAKAIFYPAAGILLAVILLGFAFLDQFNALMTFLFGIVTDWTGWFMLIVSAFLLFVCFAVAFGPLGKKKVGGEDAQVQYKAFTWIAMTICSGIATAVVFYAVAEPIGYFHNPPAWWYLDPETPRTAVRAIQQSAFHWGFIYYGMFAFWGLVTGYMVYNHNLPPRPSSALYPIMHDKIFSWQGKVIDVLSMMALIGGLVTSLGFGVQQFAAGLNYVFGIEPTNLIYVITIVLVVLSYTLSSGRGVQKGMAIISNINAYIYIFLIVFLFIVGNTVFEFKLLTESIGSTITQFIPSIMNADPFDVGEGWSQGWTVFFMAWIMAYAPLIGLFLAKISKGRTWRAYLLVNILVPGTFVILWFVSFGGNAIYQDFYNGADIGAQVAELGLPVASFALLSYMPLNALLVPIVVAALFFSFITLADAMTGTLGAMSVEGVIEDSEAPVAIKFAWGIIMGGMTLLCLFCLGSSGTTSLQNMSIVFALPIFIITIGTVVALTKMVNGKVDEEFATLSADEKEKLANANPIGRDPSK